MGGRGPQTFKKRQKEQQRKERQQEKLAKRLQRRQESRTAPATNQGVPVAAEEGESTRQNRASESP